MITIGVEMTGWAELQQFVGAVYPNMTLIDAGRVLERVAEEIILDAQMNYVPFLTGTLLASGYVGIIDMSVQGQVSVEMGFGAPGSKADTYAVEQHEVLFYYHPIGSAKYLEIPFTNRVGILSERIAEGMRTS